MSRLRAALLACVLGCLPPARPAAAADRGIAPSDVRAFGRLPVLHQGRLKPLDTVARSSLLMLRGRQSLSHEGRKLGAAEWLLDVMARPEAADGYKAFRVDDPEVLAMLGLGAAGGRYFSFREIEPGLEELGAQAERAGEVEPARRTRVQRAAVVLAEQVSLYHRLKNTLQTEGAEDFPAEIEAYRRAAREGRGPRRNHPPGAAWAEHDPSRGPAGMHEQALRWDFLRRAAVFLPLPPSGPEGPDGWSAVGRGLLEAAGSGELHPGIAAYARMLRAWRRAEPEGFRAALAEYSAWVSARQPLAARKARWEALFNRARPFYFGMLLYLAACLLVSAAWLAGSRPALGWACAALWAAFGLHTGGLLLRAVLEARPPVTNLYSSAVFVGWVGALFGLLLERRFRGGLGGFAAGVMGFATLIIAQHLAVQGDTMEMMRAVLDSNFWLATHVVTITVGYGACFLASLLAHIHIFRSLLARPRDRGADLALGTMTYSAVCFALFFSFLGTVLGGIWADQSWGRFWGWDPKENGALLIVLWCAIILHARWGGFIRERGLMVMAVFGGVITSLSWFGVNMLGIGLHSYGFMDKAFVALAAFVSVQLAVMALGAAAR